VHRERDACPSNQGTYEHDFTGIHPASRWAERRRDGAKTTNALAKQYGIPAATRWPSSQEHELEGAVSSGSRMKPANLAGRFGMGPCATGWPTARIGALQRLPIMPRLPNTLTTRDSTRARPAGHTLPIPVHMRRAQGTSTCKAELAQCAGTGMAGLAVRCLGASNRPMEEIAQATIGPKWFRDLLNREGR